MGMGGGKHPSFEFEHLGKWWRVCQHCRLWPVWPALSLRWLPRGILAKSDADADHQERPGLGNLAVG